MKRYVILQCSACKRTKDSLVNLTHYAPDRCTITLNCEGRLTPTGFTSDGTAALSVPPTGLSNWYPRGTTVTTNTALKDTALYNTSTGAKQQVIIALPGTYPATATVTVKLIAEQQTAKDYRQYTYRRTGAFMVLNGIEDAQVKKVLRYTSADTVEVYVNGVKRNRGVGADQYQLSDGAAPPNSVLFNSTITGNSQIDVIVTAASTASAVTLRFTRMINDESRAGLGAWEGVDTVSSASMGVYSLFYCDFSEDNTLALDIRLRLSPDFDISGLAGAILLLSRAKLFTQLDRQRSKCIKLESLVTNTDYLVVKFVDGKRTLLVTEDSSVDIFPALAVNRFGTRPRALQTSNLLGNSGSAELNSSLIVGPDV